MFTSSMFGLPRWYMSLATIFTKLALDERVKLVRARGHGQFRVLPEGMRLPFRDRHVTQYVVREHDDVSHNGREQHVGEYLLELDGKVVQHLYARYVFRFPCLVFGSSNQHRDRPRGTHRRR